MVRICDGKSLPKGDRNAVYMLRTFGGEAHEIWNVANPENPVLITRIGGLKDTHKNWWECDTGIAFLVSGAPDWRTRRMTQVYDLSDPAHPVKIRDFGLPGQEPGSTGAVPTELHGPISTGPAGNRVYFGYGTNKGGFLQIVDREKLLNGPKEPTPENLRLPEIARMPMSAMNGAHTTFPMKDMPITEFAKDKDGKTRDIVMIVDEAILNECNEPRQMVWFADVTVEKLPMMISNYTVKEVERQFLRTGRAVRRALLQREHGAGVLQEDGLHLLLQRRRSRARHSRSLSSRRSRLLHSGDHGGDRQALRQDRREGALQGRDPDQQCRDRRARLHLHRRPRQYRPAHSGIDRTGARRRRIAMRRWPAILASVLTLGALPGAAALEPAAPAWREIAWPFPRDGWPAGRAFRCNEAACGGIEIYIRPKLGFCNCDSGVADDDEVDRVSDLDLISPRFAPLQPGEPIRMAGMSGRARAYELQMPDETRRAAVGIAVSQRCDLFVAVAHGAASASDVQRLAAALVETNEIRRWVQTAMQLRP